MENSDDLTMAQSITYFMIDLIDVEIAYPFRECEMLAVLDTEGTCIRFNCPVWQWFHRN